MDYNDKFEENELPKRTDSRYKRIEKFNSYELTHCIIFEMATRNKDVKKLIKDIANIKLVQDNTRKFINSNIDSLFDPLNNEIENKISESTRKEYSKWESTYSKLVEKLKNEYLILFDQNKVNIPELENPFKEKNFEGMSIEEIHEEFQSALRTPIMKHISGGIGKFLHGEEYPLYKSDNNIFDGFVVARGIETNCNTFNISNINTHFQRKIYDTNRINVSLNMSLPEEELIDYIKHIKKTLSEDNGNKLKSPNRLLGKDVKEIQKTKNYPKKQTPTKLADMFFVYDYVTAKLEELKCDSQLMIDEYNEEKENIKKDQEYTVREKKIQLQALLEVHEKNKTSIKIENIFKDFDKYIDGIDFKSSTASNYYYALKPYIEECRYPEFLTGESIIENNKEEK